MAACLILLFQAKGTYFPTPLFVPPVAEARSKVKYLIVWKEKKAVVEEKGFWNKKKNKKIPKNKPSR